MISVKYLYKIKLIMYIYQRLIILLALIAKPLIIVY